MQNSSDDCDIPVDWLAVVAGGYGADQLCDFQAVLCQSTGLRVMTHDRGGFRKKCRKDLGLTEKPVCRLRHGRIPNLRVDELSDFSHRLSTDNRQSGHWAVVQGALLRREQISDFQVQRFVLVEHFGPACAANHRANLKLITKCGGNVGHRPVFAIERADAEVDQITVGARIDGQNPELTVDEG